MPKSSATTDPGGLQTAEEHVSQFPNITDTPSINGTLNGNKYGSCALKRYEELKTTYQVKREGNKTYITPQYKQSHRGKQYTLAERVSWYE